VRIRMDRIVSVLAVGLFTLAGCGPDDPSAPSRIAGQIPDARITAIGNSLTAGFLNNGLVVTGQRAGYANVVARQITGRDMSLPLIDLPGLGSSTDPDTGAPLGTAYVTPTGQIAFRELPTTDPRDLLLAAALPVPYDNVGVPGALTADVLETTSAINSVSPGNLFFDLILRNSALPPGDTTQLDQLESLVENGLPGTSLVMYWVGNNDVLGGALGGDPVEGVNVTPPSAFASLTDAALARIDALDVPQVVVLNVPDVTAIPFVTSIAGLLSQGGLTPADLNTAEENVAFVLLTAQTLLFEADGSVDLDYVTGASATPETLPSNLTLTQAEVVVLQQTVAAFNDHLATAVDAGGRDWALVDANSLLSGLPLDPTAPLNSLFPLVPSPAGGLVQNEGSAFSLDGVHPSERGYARLANAVLESLNTTYGTEYPLVDLAGVENTIGFEDFGGAAGRTAPTVDPEADVFRAVVEFVQQR